MPRLTIVTTATAVPMGAQAYERHIVSRAAAALAALAGPDEDWRVRHVVARSLRSPLAGTLRLPMGWLGDASPSARAAAGRLAYARGGLVHRMNLELPPAPREVVTLHDVVAWRYADESAPVAAAAHELRRAAAVVCVSAFTAAEAVDLLGLEDPVVVPNGVEDRYFGAAPLGADALAGLGVEGPYVLTAGGASERKNLAALAEAWPRVHSARPDVTLVLAGPPHARRTELFGALPGVRFVGRVSDEVLPRLYAAASVVVVPSLVEGFGLPALEGMATGVPVVASDRSSLPEVVGDGGLLVEPTGGALADGILDVLAGGDDVEAMARRGLERSRRFTWEASAEGHARVWRSVGD
ncbi:glycosyltransferase family 1 protein [Terrabacter sp. Root181]|uniref:glycosyltransferase family 4 protein n=1 Tax=Terrabacter sp. Root181 TaxID=1736484 RepID=UPI0006F91B72|nr:glycosyltransferase family 1 protein [Terrabacter sp. Root181]KRB43417.1 group 1 glycosyl transferase [Terrabacter sp. Root181]